MDYEGLVVESHYMLNNRLGSAPSGTKFIVSHARGGRKGVTLESLPCDCCGLTMSISCVPEDYFEILDIEFNKNRLSWNQKRKYVIDTYRGRFLKEPDGPEPIYLKSLKITDS